MGLQELAGRIIQEHGFPANTVAVTSTATKKILDVEDDEEEEGWRTCPSLSVAKEGIRSDQSA